MSVKGETQHRLIRRGMMALLQTPSVELSAHEQESCRILVRRADLGLDRLKKRKGRRAAVTVTRLAEPRYISWQCSACLNDCVNDGVACPCGAPGPNAVTA